MEMTTLMISVGVFGLVCVAVGYWLGETMAHANTGFHSERPFSSLTWRNYTHHWWPNLVYRVREWRKEPNPHHRRIG